MLKNFCIYFFICAIVIQGESPSICNATEPHVNSFITNSCSSPQPIIIDGKFFNPDPVKKSHHTWSERLKLLFMEAEKWPNKIVYPAIKPDWSQLPPPHTAEIWWLGHACFLIRTNKYNILTDPIWDHRAGPFGIIGRKRVFDPVIELKDLPKIDFILISHNHHDHLSLPTLEALYKLQQDHPPIILCGEGVDHSISNSYPQEYISTTSHWDSYYPVDESAKIFFVRAQHWSQRNLFDENKSLWGGFIIDLGEPGSIYFAGDTGYNEEIFNHLASIEEGWHAIKVALLPIGSYAPEWFKQYNHLGPIDAVKVFCDLGFNKPESEGIAIGMHYGTFSLGTEGFEQAPRELRKALEGVGNSQNFLLLTPGQSRIVDLYKP